MSGPNDSKRDGVHSLVIGDGLALALTGAAFALVYWLVRAGANERASSQASG